MGNFFTFMVGPRVEDRRVSIVTPNLTPKSADVGGSQPESMAGKPHETRENRHWPTNVDASQLTLNQRVHSSSLWRLTPK